MTPSASEVVSSATLHREPSFIVVRYHREYPVPEYAVRHSRTKCRLGEQFIQGVMTLLKLPMVLVETFTPARVN